MPQKTVTTNRLSSLSSLLSSLTLSPFYRGIERNPCQVMTKKLSNSIETVILIMYILLT